MNSQENSWSVISSVIRKLPAIRISTATALPILDIAVPQVSSYSNMDVNGHGNWLSNNPAKHAAPDSSNCLSPSPPAIEQPHANLDLEATVPGGRTASLASYKASLASRLKQLNDGHHAALVYTRPRDPAPLVHKGTYAGRVAISTHTHHSRSLSLTQVRLS